MIKLFATDLDGTLLQPGNVIKETDKQSIHTLQTHGIDFAVATGRMERDITEICKQLGYTGHKISQNGAFAHTRDGHLIGSHTFDAATSKAIHQTIIDFPTPISVNTETESYISEKTPEIKAVENLLYFPITEGIDFLDDYGKSIHPSKFMLFGYEDQLVPLQKELQDQFGSEIESYLSDPRCVDIVPKGVSKAEGLKQLATHLSIDPMEIAVIGDSYNDIPMFEMTQTSFAMASAPAPVQDKASHVVEDVHQAIDYITNHVTS
ncbi:HAD superfamily hydrolase [Gracilibacillus halophilus YIM-C55.5]|uniref:HAD superfamily hydrolase n=1 Tax=Gracilibacillus halophilus YIM-C55.5 TaxID=1308866 RepID=N4WML0_9BACI|nr:Cof-type HAD-IIB family hydrolase [Gracilibacillus halophilus]ENH95760.1 HAD superfamily hydrolase [Gracilibacillus halophilus YIM-C55.5]